MNKKYDLSLGTWVFVYCIQILFNVCVSKIFDSESSGNALSNDSIPLRSCCLASGSFWHFSMLATIVGCTMATRSPKNDIDFKLPRSFTILLITLARSASDWAAGSMHFFRERVKNCVIALKWWKKNLFQNWNQAQMQFYLYNREECVAAIFQAINLIALLRSHCNGCNQSKCIPKAR